MDCCGDGRRTVVREAGFAGDHKTRDAVAPRVREELRVGSYDDANTGRRSDRASTPRTAREIVADLHTTPRAAGEEPPFLLVGFSFGGLTKRLYAGVYRQDVAGVVLVESNHLDEAEEFETHLAQDQIKEDLDSQRQSRGRDVFRSFEQVQGADVFPDVPSVVVTAGISLASWRGLWSSLIGSAQPSKRTSRT